MVQELKYVGFPPKPGHVPIQTSQQYALVVQGVALALPRERALEFRQVVVGRLAHDVPVKLAFR